MNGFLRDLGLAARMMRRRPGLTCVTLLVLGLGIGGNIAVFSVMDALLLRPPAVGEPERLVRVRARWLEERRSSLVSFPDYQDCRTATGVFSGLAAYAVTPVALLEQGVPETLQAHLVSHDYFDVLMVPMARGRGLGSRETASGDPPVAVLSASLWRRRFQADPDVLRREITINGRTFAVAGIAPDGFSGLDLGEPADLWIPLAPNRAFRPAHPDVLSDRGAPELSLVGRLAEGTTRAQAAAAMSAVASRIARDHPAQHSGPIPEAWTLDLSPLRGGIRPDARGEAAAMTLLLAGVAGAVLLIACANVAALLLGRSAERQQEMAVRRALGATRGRLVRQMLTESLLLALGAGGVSVLLASWGLESLLAGLGASHDLAGAAAPGGRVLAYAGALSAAAGLLFGLFPALSATRLALFSSAAGGAHAGRTVTGRTRLQSMLVVGQVFLSMVLLVSAGMLLSGLRQSLQSPPGFETRTVVTVSFDTGLLGYTRERSLLLMERLLERAAAMPGVQAASVTSLVPLSGIMAGNAIHPAVPDGGPPGEMRVHFADIWPGFFATLNIPIRAGRDFARSDAPGALPVAIVNESLARRAWPGASAVGQQLHFGEPGAPALTVIGVVADIRHDELDETPGPFLYFPYLQNPPFRSEAALLVRTQAPPGSLLEQLRHEMGALEPHLPLTRSGTLEQFRHQRADKDRGVSFLLTLFGGLALLLAALGLHGVMAFAVVRRTRETGIRLALGALPRDISRAFLGEGVRLALMGVGAGAVVAALSSRVLSGVLFGAGAADVLVHVSAAAVLCGSAALASWIPARRAARTDPMAALRDE